MKGSHNENGTVELNIGDANKFQTHDLCASSLCGIHTHAHRAILCVCKQVSLYNHIAAEHRQDCYTVRVRDLQR